MSEWELVAAIGGYAKANSTEDEGGISKEEASSLADWLDEPPIWH